MHASPAYKNVGRKETVQELYCLKAWQISKDYARSREITNEPYTSLNYENTDKNLVFIAQLQTLHEILHQKNTFEELDC